VIFKRGRAIPRNISRHTISAMILFIPSPPYHAKLHIFYSTLSSYKYIYNVKRHRSGKMRLPCEILLLEGLPRVLKDQMFYKAPVIYVK
jgi:hypothetical protein